MHGRQCVSVCPQWTVRNGNEERAVALIVSPPPNSYHPPPNQ